MCRKRGSEGRDVKPSPHTHTAIWFFDVTVCFNAAWLCFFLAGEYRPDKNSIGYNKNTPTDYHCTCKGLFV